MLVLIRFFHQSSASKPQNLSQYRLYLGRTLRCTFDGKTPLQVPSQRCSIKTKQMTFFRIRWWPAFWIKDAITTEKKNLSTCPVSLLIHNFPNAFTNQSGRRSWKSLNTIESFVKDWYQKCSNKASIEIEIRVPRSLYIF